MSAVAEKLAATQPQRPRRDCRATTRGGGDAELPRLFASAERLHSNFYHGFLKSSFEIHRRDALKLVEKLKLHL
ncbi:hypothetical protein [Pyrobaculum sp.]|uniref:hypothetical protein n=1 Tax=Pyrobaculum sp. TaxID=2004705 RepID=UPI0031607859